MSPPSRPGNLPPAPLLRAALIVGCLLLLAAGAYLAVRLLAILAPVTIAVIVALLLAALIGPLTEYLKRRWLPRTLAAALAVLGLIVAVAGALFFAGQGIAAQQGSLRTQIGAGIVRLRQFLAHGPLRISDQQIDRFRTELLPTLRRALPSPLTGAASAVEVLGAIVLSIILLFFLLRDGPSMWCWLVRQLPLGDHHRIDLAGRAGWRSLSSYARGIVAIAATDAIGIGISLFALRVPLALSLTLLVFLFAFVPIVGAAVGGGLAALITLVTNGLGDAILVSIAVVVVLQAEGHLLQPVVMRRAVRLHPVVTLLAIGVGGVLAGVVGALIAVPLCAFVYHATGAYRAASEKKAGGGDGPGGPLPDS
ncbi:AI-2E family transporter [Micromonospora sp. DR5-3]|uniref:AI-2E family transporter n=1 Tax=unclassified Micromonospora TaxID=2617518 RepID=UPI001652089F|nr:MULTISPECIES: AI-2E family transporter [unclassified Micromonospora]MCW3820580.1 AI-2E family transporter [Micromonospora sp. DR5-3]